jgi:predicted molibdopterin-dependent oxidoreductase YjgC
MGENPMMTDPNTHHVEKAFRALELMVVQDIFPSETAFLAHVLLPASSSLEKEGTFTNTERRVQNIHPVLPAPGAARPDWWIVGEIATRYERLTRTETGSTKWRFNSSQEILLELAKVTPIYGGITSERVEGRGIQWPCPDPEHPGTPILHVGEFARGKGKFNPVTAVDPAEGTDDEYPLILSTGRVLYHYHSGTMTRRSKPLNWREPRGFAEIHPADAAEIALEDGHAVILRSRRGEVRTKARISENVPQGTVFLAFHWREAPANILTQDHTLDPIAKIPEYKVSAIQIENPRTKASRK